MVVERPTCLPDLEKEGVGPNRTFIPVVENATEGLESDDGTLDTSRDDKWSLTLS